MSGPRARHSLRHKPQNTPLKFEGPPNPIRLQGSVMESTHLSRVDDDAHPGAAEAPAWKCVQEDTTNSRPWDTPGLVKVIEAKEHAVCYPAPPAKYAHHPGQQHTPKEKLLSQNRIEDSVHHKQGEEPPGAHQTVQHFL